MGRKKNTEVSMGKSQTPWTVNCSVTARNLRKSDLAGVILGCKHSTMQECFSQQLFGLPAPHFTYIKNITPGLPLFLFNYSDRQLHGIFEAASNGQLNIDPYAWSEEGSESTPFPAQVRVQTRMRCQPLAEDRFQPIIAENYYDAKYFWNELDHAQTKKLLDLFSSSPIAASISVSQSRNRLLNTTPTFDRMQESSCAETRSGYKISYCDALGWEDEGQHDAVVTTKQRTENAQEGLPLETRKPSYLDVLRKKNPLPPKEDESKSTWLDTTIPQSKPGRSWNAEPSSSWDAEPCCSFVAEPGCSWDAVPGSTWDAEPGSSWDAEPGSSWDAEPGSTWDAEGSTWDETPALNMEFGNSEQHSTECKVHLVERSCSLNVESEHNVEKGNKSLEASTENGRTEEDDKTTEEDDETTEEDDDSMEEDEETTEEDDETTEEGDITMESREEKGPHMKMKSAEFDRILSKLMREMEELNASHLRQIEKVDSLEVELAESKREVRQLQSHLKLLQLGPPAPGDSILIVGGFDGSSWLSTLESYSPSSDIVMPLSQMTFSRSHATITKVKDEFFVLGGVDGSSNLWYDSVVSYNPMSNQWVSRPSLRQRKGSLAGASVNDKVFAIGGGNGVECFSEVEVFDLDAGRWIPIRSMLQKRFAAAAAVINGIIYVTGGYDGNDYLKSVERYDSRMGSWTSTSNMSMRRGCHCLAVLNEKLYALGGYDGGKMNQTIEVFDPRIGLWMSGPSMNDSRGYAAALTFEESVYVIGGVDSEKILDTVECYKESTGWQVTNLKGIGKRCFFSAAVM